MNKIIYIPNLSNQQFIEQYAKPGCIALVGGTHFIDESIKKAQKKITTNGKQSLWSHAFIFSGLRQDGHIWLIESDLEFHKKQIKLGVQENRAEKYFDKTLFPHIAILDFNLNQASQNKLIAQGLNLVAAKVQYSIREIFGVLYTMFNAKASSNANILAQNNSFFCSAMVQHCYAALNINFNNNITTKNITPQHIYTTNQPCVIYTNVNIDTILQKH